MSPRSADSSGTLLNINADTVAAALAVALKAEKLILATGAPGILEDASDPDSLVSYLDLAGLRALREKGSLAEGMMPKAASIEAALTGGVRRVHIMSVRVGEGVDPLLVLEVHRERHLDEGRPRPKRLEGLVGHEHVVLVEIRVADDHPVEGDGRLPLGLEEAVLGGKEQLVEKPVRELENLVDLHETIMLWV